MDNQVNHSYFYAFDTEKGWNYSAYFSFWNEFNRDNDSLKYVECVALLFLMLISLVINTLFIVLYCRQRGLRTVTNLFILLVCIASLIMLPCALLIAITRVQRDWGFGNFGCHFVMFDLLLMACAKIWIMALISIERLLKIVYSHKKSLELTIRRAFVLVIFVFLVTVVTLIPMSVLSVQSKTVTLTDGTEAKICTISTIYHPKLRVSLLLFGLILMLHYILPISIIIGCYNVTIHKLKKLIGQMKGYRKSIYNKKLRKTNEKRKAISMLIAMLVATVLMWVPFFGMLGVVAVDTVTDNFQVRSSYFIIILAIIICNTILNPIIYGFSTSNVKKAARMLFTREPQEIDLESTTMELKPITPSQLELLVAGTSSSNE